MVAHADQLRKGQHDYPSVSPPYYGLDNIVQRVCSYPNVQTGALGLKYYHT